MLETMCEADQINKIQLENETSEQKLHELQETSQEANTTDLENVASSRKEWNEFKCPICLDILKNTRITKNCSHRFCKDCIITALRRGKKECPICRRKLISKRYLDPDPHLDAIISKMYPGCNKEGASKEDALVRRKYKTLHALNFSTENEQGRETQQKEEQKIETSSGWEGNHDSLPCSNASIHSSGEAGPSNKCAKTSLMPQHDKKGAIMTIKAVSNGTD